MNDQLSKIESMRQKILSYPIPSDIETKLKWQAIVSRVFWSLSLSDNPFTRRRIEDLLKNPVKKRLAPEQKQVVNYKAALDLISRDWFITPKPVTVRVIQKLYSIACSPTTGLGPEISENKRKTISHFLEYLRSSLENPIIQAGIVQFQIINTKPYDDGNGRLARLTGLLFLYKYGLDFRGLLNISEYFRRDVITLSGVTEGAKKRENLTIWLEYYSKAISTQLSKAFQVIEKAVHDPNPDKAFWLLSDRQKDIISMLDIPGIKITNKKVRKKFKISQITASRDLSRLASLGLVFTRGKGRSVYYTKV